MPSSRKFFKQVIQVTVLSEDLPLEWDSLEEVHNAITFGECSGKIEEISSERIPASEAAKLLMDQASDPGFFSLDEEGNDVEEE